jgi:hypothetical protein
MTKQITTAEKIAYMLAGQYRWPDAMTKQAIGWAETIISQSVHGGKLDEQYVYDILDAVIGGTLEYATS